MPSKFQKQRELRELVLQSVCKDIHEAEDSNGGRAPYGFVKEIVENMKGDHPWVTRNTIRHALEKYKFKLKETALQRERDEAAASQYNTGGRPKGTTKLSKREFDVNLIQCKNEITAEYQSALNDAKALGTCVRKGFMDQLIREKKLAHGISLDVKISPSTIYSRVCRGKLEVYGLGPETPMHLVEPKLVELIIRMSRIRRCLTPFQCLHLANDLIKGTEIEKNVIAYKEKQFRRKFESADLGNRYWQGFKKRWDHKLTNKRGQKFSLDRANATTYTNLAKMYTEVYDAMVECNVAIKLDVPVYKDQDGNICDELNSFGVKCTHEITQPDMCLVVDEVGSNLSQKGDGHIGGQKYVCERGSVPQNKVQHRDSHFTLLGFTALNGEPVLCVIVMAGKKEKFGIETGIDPCAEVIGNVDDEDFFEKNYGLGKLFPSGPVCNFRNVDIPCLVKWSEKGSITSEILAQCLEHIDSYNVFPRVDGISPFLLLDGHGSRFEIPFLDYITNPDHEWQVCIGVPYGTSLWQVADSKEQNGSYKIALARAKKIFEDKLSMFIDPPTLERFDIIGLVNEAWASSFAKVDTNKKAICERGWGPCNRNLLKYREIQNSMTNQERSHFEAHYGHQFPPTDSLTLPSPSSQTSQVSDLSQPSFTLTENNNNVTMDFNYSSGNSAMVIEALVGENDLMEARERIRLKKQRGEEASSIFDSAKALTAMVHFNEIGCKIGKSALEKKKHIAHLQRQKKLDSMEKELAEFNQRKMAYDAVVNLKIEDEKLSNEQLMILLNYKKRKSDKGISQLKKKQKLHLWKEWKTRWVVEPEQPSHVEMVGESGATEITNNTCTDNSESVFTETEVAI